MKTAIITAAMLLATASPAMAAPGVASNIGESQWDANRLTTDAAKTCQVPVSQVLLEKTVDGIARVQVSPSLSSGQVACLKNMIRSYGVQIKD